MFYFNFAPKEETMFGKKKPVPQIDKEQLALIKNAERRIKQKKRLYIHFVIFLIGAVFLIVANTGLGIGEDFEFLGIKQWFVYAISLWLFIFINHFINVFITHNFMGKDWEQQELDKLVAKQKARIEALQLKVEKENPLPQRVNQTQHITSSPAIHQKNLLTMIVAAGEDNAIGKDNKLIWHLKDDLQRFKKLTSGHHIIMGRITYESLKMPLPNRTHIVITRQQNYKVPEGVIVVDNLPAAIEAAKTDSQPFIIGGGEIYNQGMAIADRIEMTRVHSKFDGDTYFPEISPFKWKEVSRKYHTEDSSNEYPFSFITYDRIQ
ncbi:dihydrofolate reductase [Flavobacteriaceae bacterium MAR_2010_188]|nr:dihydrofolate reductase [Flavobacteriaceae bacterium MAR_2010_188]